MSEIFCPFSTCVYCQPSPTGAFLWFFGPLERWRLADIRLQLVRGSGAEPKVMQGVDIGDRSSGALVVLVRGCHRGNDHAIPLSADWHRCRVL